MLRQGHRCSYIKSAAAILKSDFNSDVPKTVDELCSLRKFLPLPPRIPEWFMPDPVATLFLSGQRALGQKWLFSPYKALGTSMMESVSTYTSIE